MKKRTPQKVKTPVKSKTPKAQGAEPGFLIETDEKPGVHILGKQDLQRHFGPSQVGDDHSHAKK